VTRRARRHAWFQDARLCLSRGTVHTARALLACARVCDPQRASPWLRSAALERTHGSAEALRAVLDEAIVACPQCVILWLMCAKAHWSGSEEGCVLILVFGFDFCFFLFLFCLYFSHTKQAPL
jgi:hypothetical protein